MNPLLTYVPMILYGIVMALHPAPSKVMHLIFVIISGGTFFAGCIRHFNHIVEIYYRLYASRRESARKRALNNCHRLVQSARALCAIAIIIPYRPVNMPTKERVIADITQFYNCLVDQQMLSTERIAEHFKGLARITVSLAAPYNGYSIISNLESQNTLTEFRYPDGTIVECVQ